MWGVVPRGCFFDAVRSCARLVGDMPDEEEEVLVVEFRGGNRLGPSSRRVLGQVGIAARSRDASRSSRNVSFGGPLWEY